MGATRRGRKASIDIFGAREHNLKNIDISIPKNTLTVITGPSGSGKSSLALDILFVEGRRRYTESLSSYARQFLGVSRKPDVDRIEGLCPAIAIEQKTISTNPRSTVGTVTELYDLLRVLFARAGTAHCPQCNAQVQGESVETIVELLLQRFAGQVVTVAAPLVRDRKGEYVRELCDLLRKGFYRFRVDGTLHKFRSDDEIHALKLAKTKRHSIDLIVDSLEVGPEERARLGEAVTIAFSKADGLCSVLMGEEEHSYSNKRICLPCGESLPEFEPRLFSFNSPTGACQTCHGLGIINEWPWADDDPDAWKARYPDFFGPKYAKQLVCRGCNGTRLNKYAGAVRVGDKTIFELGELSLAKLKDFFQTLALDTHRQEVASGLLAEISNRLNFLCDIGLSYLTLNRSARTLSGGEGQRIRLATQIGSALSGVLYVLDEPSIGLHQRDNDRLIETLKALRDQGNTVVVVEHDLETMRAADHLIDMGPAAGVRGGRVTASGSPKQVARVKGSLSGAYLSGARTIAMPEQTRKPTGFMTLAHARKNNLKDITVQFPLGVLCGVSGVSGSGKSTLVMEELVPALHRELGGYSRRARRAGGQTDLAGADPVQSMVVIDQSPIGRTPRSNPATYLGIFDEVRRLFSSLPESNIRGYKPGRFSFNVSGGRCQECAGDGTITVEMHFLAPVTITCKACRGARYNAETLQITYRGKTISDVLDMTAWEARTFFTAHDPVARRLQLMCDVGLDYLKLGQPSTTLSGGEAQRIKLVDELAKRGSGTLYVLDEPTTGLHNCDVERLLVVLNRLVNRGNTVLVIEHNLDFLKTVDYLIDLGLEGGDAGGTMVTQGTPQDVAAGGVGYTAQYLRPFFGYTTQKMQESQDGRKKLAKRRKNNARPAARAG